MDLLEDALVIRYYVVGGGVGEVHCHVQVLLLRYCSLFFEFTDRLTFDTLISNRFSPIVVYIIITLLA